VSGISSRPARRLAVAIVLLLVAGFASSIPGGSASAAVNVTVKLTATPASAGLSKIKHVIVIMQENRSFDHYFGMYPGADGIPVDGNGNPTVCVNDPKTGDCVYPWHDSTDVSNGGPHGVRSANKDVNGGAMDGFISEYETGLRNCLNKPGSPDCGVPKPQPDVMSYKLRSDLPEYWAYADNYVLQDHMFEPSLTWSLVAHLNMLSGWAARCSRVDDPSSCENEVDAVDDARFQASPNYAWTDITHLLNQYSVPWGYYVFDGTEPDCVNPADLTCIPLPQSYRTGSIWNPLPNFTDVRQNGQLGNIQSVDNFAAAARNGTLPAVSWVVPTNSVSEHPPAKITDGRKYVTYMVNQVMQGPDWDSSAIFLAWDDWGGFYDHVNPPRIDANGLGLRVPGLIISPYAKRGYIDHNVHSFDSYLRFIEDVFLGGARLDPTTDGRPDPRPVVRENSPVSDLSDDFDFTQPPRPPVVIGNTSAGAVAEPIHPRAAPKPPASSAPPTTSPRVGGSIFTDASSSGTVTPSTGGATGTVPFRVVLDPAGTSVSGGATATSWKLVFGDGSSTTGTGLPTAPVTHVYANAGAYTATLKVTLSNGRTHKDSALITVSPAAPKVWISGNRPLGFDDLTEVFNASQSSPGNWTISFGDGTPDLTGTGTPPAAASHHFTQVGIYTTTLTVIDPTTGLSGVARAISTVSASRAPTAVTKLPDVGADSAHLLADIWTNGKPTTFHFEWGTSPTALTNVTPERTAALGASSPAQAINGLTSGTRYYFRVVATNAVGITNGDVLSFAPTTGPRVAAQPASNITSTSVTLSGTVNPAGSSTTAWWEYGVNGALDHSTNPVDMGAGKVKLPTSVNLSGLTPATSYSFRLVAANGVGQNTSDILTFTTLS
jgi:phospholipase C